MYFTALITACSRVALQDDVEFCKGEETRKKPKETERILEKVFVFGHQKRSDFVALSAVLGESGAFVTA